MSASLQSFDIQKNRTRTISVTSGKGGVGKTTLISNLALTLSQQGQKVLILDGDLGMANVDVMYGLRAAHSLESVLTGELEMKDIVVEVAPNVHLIPGGGGVYELQNLTALQKKIILDQISLLPNAYDYLLVDTASGIGDNVLYLNAAAQEILVVVTPEPASLTDSYALIKVLNKKYRERRFSIVTNMVQDEAESLHVYRRLSDVANRFLSVSLDYKGFIPLDSHLRTATKSQQLVLQSDPRSPSSYAIRMLAEKLSVSASMAQVKGGMQFFWEQMVGVA
jgi:flagellar biosynthesis protein FlhG